MKTKYGREVQENRMYELKYKWGDSYCYGYGMWHPDKHHNVDIIREDGGVTYQSPKDVVFLRLYR